MELSKRLQAVADLVTEGASVADIGTDHGYIPIYLIEYHIAEKVIALDINRGPLERARMHVVGHGLKGKIETRLSDGLEKVLPGEVDTMIAAGMGGGLVIKILTEGYPVVEILDTMILQPQSEIAQVRAYLRTHGFRILEEEMILEDGKYYPMMKVRYAPEKFVQQPKPTDGDFLFGPMLLQAHHAVLHSYLLREQRIQKDVLKQLAAQKQTPAIAQRTKEVEAHLQLVEQSLW